jgi:hypothetical protein
MASCRPTVSELSSLRRFRTAIPIPVCPRHACRVSLLYVFQMQLSRGLRSAYVPIKRSIGMALVPDATQRVSGAAQSRDPEAARSTAHGPRPGGAPPKGLRPVGAREPEFWHRYRVGRAVSHSRGLCGPSCALYFAPKNAEGAGKAGCRLAPTVHCAKVALQEAAQRHTGEAQHTAFPAQWFYGLCRALPGERCTIAPVALRMADAADPVGPPHHRNTWRTDPGRQDHTILPYAGCTGRVRDAFAHGFPPCKALRADAACVHHIPIPRS